MSAQSDLDAQKQEVRELLAEVRGATKDLHQAIRAAKAAFGELTEEKWRQVMGEQAEQMAQLGQEACHEAVKAITGRFAALENTMIGLDRSARDEGRMSISELAALALEGRAYITGRTTFNGKRVTVGITRDDEGAST